MRHWSWGKVIREVPEPGGEKQPREESRDQLLADLADALRAHAAMIPTASPRAIGRIVRQLRDSADVIEGLQVVKHEPTLELEALAMTLYRSAGH